MRKKSEYTEESGGASEARYRSLFESLPVGIYRTTPTGQILDVNPSLIRMLGYPDREALLAVNVIDTFADPERRRLWQALIERDGFVRDFEMQVRRRDGTVIWVRDSARVVRDTDGQVLCYEGVVEDITERVRAEEALKRALEEWQQTFDALDDVVTLHDSEFRIVRANWAAARTFGCEPEDLIGKRCYQVFHGLDCPIENCPLHRSLQSGRVETLERWEPTLGKALQFTTSPIRDAEGKVIGGVHVARDITARKRTEATWRALNAAAVALQRASLTAAEIYQTATEQLAALGLRGVVTLLDEATDSFVFEHFFLPEGLLPVVERLTGITAAGFRFSRGHAPDYTRVVETGQAVYIVDSTARIVAELVSESVGELAERLVGILGPSNAVLAPLRMEDQVAGVLHVGADWLTEADVPAITAFADQLSAALENARLYQTGRRRMVELTRSNAFIAALGHVAARMETAPDPDKVMESLGIELRQLGLACFVALLEPDDQALVVHYASLEPVVLARMEKLTGLKPRGVRIPHSRWSYFTDVIGQGRALFVTDPMSRAVALLPDLAQPVVERVVRLAGVMPHTQAILLPLRVEEQVIGVLGVWGEDLQEADLPAATIFSCQVAGALERARLYAETRRRAAELETLAEVSSALRETGTTEEMMPIFLRKAAEVVGGIASTIFLVEPETGDFPTDAALGTLPSLPKGSELDLEAGKGPALVVRGWFPPDLDLAGLRHPWGEGITGHVAATGQVHISEDLARDPLAHILPEEARQLSAVRSTIALPLWTQERVVGVMHVGLGERRPFTDEEVYLLTAIAEMAGNALHRATLLEQTRQRLQRIAILRNIDMAISASLDLRVTLDIFLDQVMSHLGVHAADVLLLNPHTHYLEFAAGHGFHSRAIQQTRLRLGDGLAGRAALERRLVSIRNLPETGSAFVRTVLQDEGFISYHAVPLVARGQIKGVLEIFHRAALDPNPEWLDFLNALGVQAAIAIDNATLFEDLQRANTELAVAYDATLEGWSRALEMRDVETEGHAERVTDLTLRLTRAMEVPDAETVHIRRGALLHDIGKMGIPDAILLKPGPLTDEERETMRQHPIYAYELLSPITYLRPALDIPYCHHERWDGTGYPRGLKGEQIPLAARIFAVVDVYDALRSDRPYRSAWPERKVRNHIREQAGKHFDPRAVETFMGLLGNGSSSVGRLC